MHRIARADRNPRSAIKMRRKFSLEPSWMCAVAWLRSYDDVHVLAERGQEAHQTRNGKAREPTIEQRRYFRLVNTHDGQPQPVSYAAA